jgi:hypothetical protein
MKPVFVSEVLKSNNVFHKNRFEALMPRNDSTANMIASQSGTGRARSNSVKRKASGDIEPIAPKKLFTSSGPILELNTLDGMESKITTLKSLSGTLNDEVAKLKLDPPLENVLRIVCQLVDNIVDVQDGIVKSCNVAVPAELPAITVADSDLTSDPDPERDASSEVFSQYSQVAARRPVKKPPAATVAQARPPKPPKDPKVQAFQDAVRHSERSTLIFNLNLGTKKILNEKTILSNATLALSAAAAAVEGNKEKNPSRDTVGVLDDVISVVQNVTLFGKVTKPYENRANEQDPKNRSFFTMPIRYEFKDKDTKLEAETILRDTCKVDCATPYPTILRSCIKQTVDHFRRSYPNDFIKVAVDTQSLSLKVSRKVKGEGWYEHNSPIPLPEAVLDIRA